MEQTQLPPQFDVGKPTEVELPSQDEMLKAVGRGIQSFASVEVGLALVFASIMEPANRSDAVTALDAARHIETKLRIAQAVARAKLTGDNLSKFQSLMNRCSRRADFRHKLAHREVGYWPPAKSVADVRRQRVALMQSASSANRDREPPIYLDQIEEFCQNCHKLFVELVDFSNMLRPEQRGS